MATTVHLIGVQDGWAARTDQQDDSHTSFGEWLKRARETRGLTLEDIALQTNIPHRHLEALEQGRLGVLPEFYQRAEVRAFAREVGLDEQLALARLQAVTTAVEPQREVPREEPTHQPSIVIVPLALGTVLLTAGLVAWGIFGRTVAIEGAAASPPPATRVQQESAGPAESAGRSKDLPLRTTEDLPLREQPSSVAPGRSAIATTTDIPVSTDTPTELVVTTQPPGARVTVNGIGWGTSPVTIQHLQAGYKLVRVSKDGYVATERVLALDEGLRRALNIRLTTASQR